MSGSGREVLPDVREWSRGYPECPGVVGRSSRLYVSGGRPFQMTGSGRDSLTDVRKWSGDPPACLAVVRRPSRMSRSSQESLPNVWSAFTDVRQWSGGPL